MTLSLYREEAVQAKSDRLDGDILLAQSWSSWIIFWIVVATIIVTITYLLLVSYTKRATAMGQLVPNGGAIFINAPGNGTVSRIHVSEGQRVSAGDILFTLKDERYFSRDKTSTSQKGQRFAQQFHAALQVEESALLEERVQVNDLSQKTQHALERQIQSLNEEIIEINAQIKQHEDRVILAKNKLGKHQELVRAGFFTEHALTELEDNLVALQTQAVSYQRERKSLEGRMVELRSELLSNPNKAKISLSTIEGKLSLLQQKIQERDIQSEVNIVAPIDGVITGITALAGQLTGSQPLAILLADDAKLEAHVYLGSKEVGFAEVGQKVRLRYQAYPYQKFGQYSGTLTEISQSPVARESLPTMFSQLAGSDFYRAVIKIDSQFATVYRQEKRLVSGMIVEADIEQERRKLIEWILEPLYGFKKYN